MFQDKEDKKLTILDTKLTEPADQAVVRRTYD